MTRKMLIADDEPNILISLEYLLKREGYQVTVAVVDRAGVTQVLLRDRFAGPHTVRMAVDKAWTAVSFRTNTTELAMSRMSALVCARCGDARVSRA